jgi:DNA-binding response OmpR family regulator
MGRLLIVDDDDAMRRLLRLNLADSHEIIDTGDPEQALALALQHKPDAILLDLRMPRFSGFELCQTFTSFSTTQLIPVFVVSGEAGAKTKGICRDLGASEYFEKPVDFEALRTSLDKALRGKRPERRGEVRVRLRVPLKLRGVDIHAKSFEALTTTENVALNSFYCACPAELKKDAVVQVFLVSGGEQHVGSAQVVRSESAETSYPRYAFRFIEKVGDWVLQ